MDPTVYERLNQLEARLKALEGLLLLTPAAKAEDRSVYSIGEMVCTKELSEVGVGQECSYCGYQPGPGNRHAGWCPASSGRTSRFHRQFELFEDEVEGLDRQGVRELLRRKLQALGDELLAAWEGEQG